MPIRARAEAAYALARTHAAAPHDTAAKRDGCRFAGPAARLCLASAAPCGFGRHDHPRPAPVATRPAALPTHIGKYAVRSRLGEGATSEVFLAWDEFNQREVIKRVRAGLAQDTPEGHFQQHFFAAEAALAGGCSTPTWCRSTMPSTTARRPIW